MAAAKAQDVTALLKDMMGAFPVDTSALEDAFKTQATLNEKLSGVAFDAAEKSADISTAWTKETLSRLTEMTKVKAQLYEAQVENRDLAKRSMEALRTVQQREAPSPFPPRGHLWLESGLATCSPWVVWFRTP